MLILVCIPWRTRMIETVSVKLSFKQQQLQFRENAILDAVNRLLAQKGFDLMTMDEVAADLPVDATLVGALKLLG